MFSLQQFHYDLPPELIAHTPAQPRDTSRLLVVNKNTGALSHHHFSDLPNLLTKNDVLVRNNTKVIPARIFGQKESGGQCEILLAKQTNATTWECLTKPGLKLGQQITFPHSELTATCIQVNEFTRMIEFSTTEKPFLEELDAVGQTPVPPYIHWQKTDEQQLRVLYQTTFARIAGSVAAPTAGLHFTPELDQKLRERGILIEEITLHVGLGTFLPVREEQLQTGKLHQEWYEVSAETAQHLNSAKKNGKRIIAVGTTTTRTLETCSSQDGELHPSLGNTDLFIQPGYRFRFVDGMITNFHLPESSLLMLISTITTEPNVPQSFVTFQKTIVGQAYQEAIRQQYRFYSFGDAMLIR